MIAAINGGARTAEFHYDAISEIGVVIKAFCDESVEKVRGVITAGMARYDLAEAHFKNALE
jgi:hypothetical protein